MSRRLYAQLQPDEASLRHLTGLQATIGHRGRHVPPGQIHLTIIHFGIIDTIRRQLPCDDATAERAIASYISRNTAILHAYPVREFTLQPIGLALFGGNSRTLVVRYDTTDALDDLHAQLLHELITFFEECGIDDPKTFMALDSNFKHALTISPHITTAKGFNGSLPDAALHPITLLHMPFEYEQ